MIRSRLFQIHQIHKVSITYNLEVLLMNALFIISLMRNSIVIFFNIKFVSESVVSRIIHFGFILFLFSFYAVGNAVKYVDNST